MLRCEEKGTKLSHSTLTQYREDRSCRKTSKLWVPALFRAPLDFAKGKTATKLFHNLLGGSAWHVMRTDTGENMVKALPNNFLYLVIKTSKLGQPSGLI